MGRIRVISTEGRNGRRLVTALTPMAATALDDLKVFLIGEAERRKTSLRRLGMHDGFREGRLLGIISTRTMPKRRSVLEAIALALGASDRQLQLWEEGRRSFYAQRLPSGPGRPARTLRRLPPRAPVIAEACRDFWASVEAERQSRKLSYRSLAKLLSLSDHRTLLPARHDRLPSRKALLAVGGAFDVSPEHVDFWDEGRHAQHSHDILRTTVREACGIDAKAEWQCRGCGDVFADWPSVSRRRRYCEDCASIPSNGGYPQGRPRDDLQARRRVPRSIVEGTATPLAQAVWNRCLQIPSIRAACQSARLSFDLPRKVYSDSWVFLRRSTLNRLSDFLDLPDFETRRLYKKSRRARPEFIEAARSRLGSPLIRIRARVRLVVSRNGLAAARARQEELVEEAVRKYRGAGIGRRQARLEVGRALERPLPGRRSSTDYTKVHQWRQEGTKWIVVGVRLDRDPESVRVSYNRWLKENRI